MKNQILKKLGIIDLKRKNISYATFSITEAIWPVRYFIINSK